MTKKRWPGTSTPELAGFLSNKHPYCDGAQIIPFPKQPTEDPDGLGIEYDQSCAEDSEDDDYGEGTLSEEAYDQRDELIRWLWEESGIANQALLEKSAEIGEYGMELAAWLLDIEDVEDFLEVDTSERPTRE